MCVLDDRRTHLSVLRLPQVVAKTGLSRSTIWRLERDSLFPSRIQLSPNAVGWSEAEVAQWLAKRPRRLPTRTRNALTRRPYY